MHFQSKSDLHFWRFKSLILILNSLFPQNSHSQLSIFPLELSFSFSALSLRSLILDLDSQQTYSRRSLSPKQTQAGGWSCLQHPWVWELKFKPARSKNTVLFTLMPNGFQIVARCTPKLLIRDWAEFTPKKQQKQFLANFELYWNWTSLGIRVGYPNVYSIGTHTHTHKHFGFSACMERKLHTLLMCTVCLWKEANSLHVLLAKHCRKPKHFPSKKIFLL